MKTWVVVMINHSEPEHKVYLAGSYTSKDAAKARITELSEPGVNELYMVDMLTDNAQQPPILVGMASDGFTSMCKKNTPNSM
ncbi:MAG: hypothetical protein HY940_04835 [Gammaproteobacteria bacterium]|nr:hypothetical protein [Gammaproteobacteria bacterium]